MPVSQGHVKPLRCKEIIIFEYGCLFKNILGFIIVLLFCNVMQMNKKLSLGLYITVQIITIWSVNPFV